MIEGSFVALDEDEEELMEEIFVATREAHNNGVPKTRIAGILSYFAAGAVDPKSLEQRDSSSKTVQDVADGNDLETNETRETQSEQALCPSCLEDDVETHITDVSTQLGGQLRVSPCGHVIEWEERGKLRGWVEEFEQD